MPRSTRLRSLLVIALCGLIAFVCAVANVAQISLSPPGIKARQLEVAAATTRVAVDMPKPLVRSSVATDVAFEGLQRRAVLIANLMTSDQAMQGVARTTGIPRAEIAANTRVVYNAQDAMLEPDYERRAAEIADSRLPYQLEVRPDPTYPTITIYAQAPSVMEAQRLADAVLPAVRGLLAGLARREGAGPASRMRFEQLGAAQGAVVNGGSKVEIFLLTFLCAFGLTAAVPFLILYVRRRRDRSTSAPPPEIPVNGNGNGHRANGGGGVPALAGMQFMQGAVALPLSPPIALPRPGARSLGRVADRVRAAAADDWPRTPRLLPWLIAAFMAVVWLVPFNAIELTVHLPVDLKLDRLILPGIFVVWILALAAGGAAAPRLRLSPIHFAAVAMLGVACLSLVLDAHTLNRTLLFDLGFKKLTLLGAYVAMFVMTASVIRRGEVQAFLTFTLILASLCAFGTIVEYRMHFNVFYWASDKLLPGIFEVAQVNSGAVDQIGRHTVVGPGQVGLEDVAMMAMALPIALARLIHAGPRQRRWLYSAVIALLMAGMLSTFRKTGLLAPVSVCLTFAYFRRRELLKLAPLGVVLILVIQVLSPGALRGVAGQLSSNRLGVTTVDDRAADYDAVRPDVWSHLAFGRGYGTYDHMAFRILDQELLGQLIEVGVVGLLIYLALPITVLAVARAPIRARGPDAPIALAVAAVAVSFLVVSTLFDAMSFPHVPYIFLFMAAILSVVKASGTSRPEP